MIITREALLKAAGFDPQKDLALSLKRVRQAHHARTSKGQPDHMVRLHAAEVTFDLADVRKPRNDGADPSRPVSVNIILGQPARALDAGREGYVLSLSTPQIVEGQVIEPKATDMTRRGQGQLPGIVEQ